MQGCRLIAFYLMRVQVQVLHTSMEAWLVECTHHATNKSIRLKEVDGPILPLVSNNQLKIKTDKGEEWCKHMQPPTIPISTQDHRASWTLLSQPTNKHIHILYIFSTPYFVSKHTTMD